LSTLSGRNRGYIQFTKLHFCFHTEKVLCPLDQRVIQRKTYITNFKFLKNVFLVTGVFHFHIVLKVEGVVVVEVGGHGEFFTNLSNNAHVDLHVKFKSTIALLTNWYRRIADFLPFTTKVKCDKSAWHQFYITTSKNSV